MPRIEIGAGIVLAVLATFGIFGSVPVAAVLLAGGVILIMLGTYEEFIKPRFRVDHRLKDWFIRRGWHVGVERRPAFNFLIRLTSPSSGKEVFVTREKATYDDLIAFTGKVPYLPEWFAILPSFSEEEREALITDIRIYLTTKNVSPNFRTMGTNEIAWPPEVVIQAALAQDHTLSQHSVDIAAKTIELAIIGVRDLIRKAVAVHVAAAAVPKPSLEPVPDTEPLESQAEP